MSIVHNLQELPQLLQTLSQLYESSGDAKVYGMYSLLANVNAVSGSYLLTEVLSSLALLNLFKQKKIADLRKLPFMLKSTHNHLNSIREMMPVSVLQLRQPYRN